MNKRSSFSSRNALQAHKQKNCANERQTLNTLIRTHKITNEKNTQPQTCGGLINIREKIAPPSRKTTTQQKLGIQHDKKKIGSMKYNRVGYKHKNFSADNREKLETRIIQK